MKLQTILLLTMLGATFDARAGDGPDYVWSARAPLVNRATEALDTGHMARAVRLAAAAQTSAIHAADKLIAAHDLCLALMSQGKTATAAAPCRTAIHAAATLSPADDGLAHDRGALVSGTAGGGESLSLSVIVGDNIARAYGARVVDDMREDIASVW